MSHCSIACKTHTPALYHEFIPVPCKWGWHEINFHQVVRVEPNKTHKGGLFHTKPTEVNFTEYISPCHIPPQNPQKLRRFFLSEADKTRGVDTLPGASFQILIGGLCMKWRSERWSLKPSFDFPELSYPRRVHGLPNQSGLNPCPLPPDRWTQRPLRGSPHLQASPPGQTVKINLYYSMPITEWRLRTRPLLHTARIQISLFRPRCCAISFVSINVVELRVL